jgi:hypothetical protein
MSAASPTTRLLYSVPAIDELLFADSFATVRDRCAGFSGKIFVTGTTDAATGDKSFVKSSTTASVGGVRYGASWEVWGFPVSNGRVTSDVLDEELAALRSESNGLDPDV